MLDKDTCFFVERVPQCRFRKADKCSRPVEERCVKCDVCGIVMLREEYIRRGAIYEEEQSVMDYAPDGSPILGTTNVSLYCSEHCRDYEKELRSSYGLHLKIDCDDRLKPFEECFD